jgi:uroporphyrinogen decarboxylase
MGKMSKAERIAAAVAGESVDRVPVSFWYHFPLEFPSGKPLADVELDFYHTYDPDFLKLMHDLLYELPQGMQQIETAADWRKLESLDPVGGNFAHQLEAIRLILEGRGDDGFVIDTVFSPYYYAKKLCGGKLMQHLQEDPESVQYGLGQIARNMADYAAAAVDRGLSGIYYAVNGATPSIMSEETYRQFFLPHDLTILESVAYVADFNVLHIHGDDIYFDLVKDLPCHAISWSFGISAPTLSAARSLTGRCLLTGIDETRIKDYTSEQAANEAKRSIQEAGAENFILASGCAVPTDTPKEVLSAVRRAVED